MSQRTEKIERLARQVLGEAIQDLKDPRVGFATVTRVRVSGDLRHALVWVSVLGNDEEQESTLAGLRSASPRLRSELGSQVRMRYLPELKFELDRGAEDAENLERIFQELHAAEAAPGGPDDGGEGSIPG
ncbi:MAG: 30S ribosome-binding factor RbfA [Actinobacteria bacterium]|nr:30S ribosome-binding factor RbfA [Actinomycetota bacterium]